MTRRHKFLKILLSVLVLLAAIFIFHYFRNRPFATMGYWVSTASQLQDEGSHFNKSGMLEVEFHYKAPYGQEHMTYSLLESGKPQPIINGAALGSTYLLRGTWGYLRFPIASGIYPKPLQLNPGKYILDFYINGKLIDKKSFSVDKSIIVQSG